LFQLQFDISACEPGQGLSEELQKEERKVGNHCTKLSKPGPKLTQAVNDVLADDNERKVV